MVKRTGPTNEHLQALIRELARDKKPLWKRVAKDLGKPRRSRRVVNLKRINRHTKSGENVIVPGKVLGVGELKHKLTVAAWEFSESALKKIKEAGATAMSLKDFHSKGMKGRILG